MIFLAWAILCFIALNCMLKLHSLKAYNVLEKKRGQYMRSCRNENKTKQKQNPKTEEEEKIKSAARRYNSFKNKNSGIVIKYKHSL